MKPVGQSRGRGIALIDDISAVSYGEAYVIQRRVEVSAWLSGARPLSIIKNSSCRYIHQPLLLDGFKFDLRLYVCVNSFSPLEAYIYKVPPSINRTVLYANDEEGCAVS